MADDEKPHIGWIGTGVMGASMAGHLLDAGYPLTVFTRTKSKADDLVRRGAQWAATPKEVADAAEIVFTIVGYPSDVASVYFDEEDGIFAAATLPRIVVDMTTSSPDLAARIANEGKKRAGVQAIDAPVSGGDVGARNATLSIMIGGEESAVAEMRPLFEIMGKRITHMGPPGAGQHTKMVNQTLIATMMIGVCEVVVDQQPRPAHREARLRAGLLRRAFHQGSAHRDRRGAANEPGPARARARRATLQRRRRPGIRAPGHAGAHARA